MLWACLAFKEPTSRKEAEELILSQENEAESCPGD